MITKEDIKAELEGCSEPEKKLHEIAAREDLPVMAVRKILRDLVSVESPKEDESVHPAHYNVGRRIADPGTEKFTHRWTEGELRIMSEYWNRHATVHEIAEIMGLPDTTVGGVVYSHRDLFPKRKVENPVWTEEEISIAADMWHDPENTINEIIEVLGRKQHDFYLLRVQNPELFPPRKTWKRRRA